MDLSSITSLIAPGVHSLRPANRVVDAVDAGQRKQLVRAANTVNESGLLGDNQALFLVDPETHRPVIRIENRETHELVQQIPQEYLLRLAEASLGDSVLLSHSQTA
jgi:uncharacterized FlaG/YvyC family protein